MMDRGREMVHIIYILKENHNRTQKLQKHTLPIIGYNDEINDARACVPIG